MFPENINHILCISSMAYLHVSTVLHE